MHKILIALTTIVVGAGSAVASQETEVMAPVRQFINGFNKGDVRMAQAACAEQNFIIDDFPPHAWAESGAPQNGCVIWTLSKRKTAPPLRP